MSDFAIIMQTVKHTLEEIGQQAKALGTGLQNVAPAEKEGKANPSVEYLLQTGDQLMQTAESLSSLNNDSTPSSQSSLS